MKSLIVTSAALVLLGAGQVMASGAGQYGQDNDYKKTVDRQYEAGKSAFYAQDASGNTVQYCINAGGQVERLSRRTLKPFVGTASDQLSNSIVRCDNSEASLVSELDSDQVNDIIYYLNKRYRLSLSQS